MLPLNSKILIVDDVPTMRQIVKGQLRQMGYSNFFEADEGSIAFQILQLNHLAGEAIQMVLCDWNMPGMSGLDLLKMVRSSPEFKSLPFLLITAEGQQAQVLEAIKSGVSSYLVKPFAPISLTEKVHAAWKRHNQGK